MHRMRHSIRRRPRQTQKRPVADQKWLSIQDLHCRKMHMVLISSVEPWIWETYNVGIHILISWSSQESIEPGWHLEMGSQKAKERWPQTKEFIFSREGASSFNARRSITVAHKGLVGAREESEWTPQPPYYVQTRRYS